MALDRSYNRSDHLRYVWYIICNLSPVKDVTHDEEQFAIAGAKSRAGFAAMDKMLVDADITLIPKRLGDGFQTTEHHSRRYEQSWRYLSQPHLTLPPKQEK